MKTVSAGLSRQCDEEEVTKLESCLCNSARSVPGLVYPALNHIVEVCESVESDPESPPNHGWAEPSLHNAGRLFTSGAETTGACGALGVVSETNFIVRRRKVGLKTKMFLLFPGHRKLMMQ